MILYIESVYGDTLLHGKPFGEADLRTKVQKLLTLVREEEITSAFCSRYDYETVPFDPFLKADYVIDLDTHLVYKPK